MPLRFSISESFSEFSIEIVPTSTGCFFAWRSTICSTTALNLPDYEVVHYAQHDEVRHFSVVPKARVELCPECSKPCQRQHQKRWLQDVADLPLGDQPVRLKVRVFQYECDHCGRHFTPKSLLFTPGLGAQATARLIRKAAELIRRADIAGADQVITATGATPELSGLLGCPAGSPVLHIERTYHDRKGEALEHAVSDFLPDHYAHRLRLGRDEPAAPRASPV